MLSTRPATPSLLAALPLALVVIAAVPGRSHAQALPDPDPATLFHELEERLLRAEVVRMDFHVTARGAVEVDLRGRWEMIADGAIEITARGDFDGRAVELRLLTEDGAYTFGAAPGLTTADVPPDLREAIVLGFTRMGILHNLARLTGDAPPDHAGGGAREWVRPHSFASADGIPSSFGFSITVAGEPSGTAALKLDASGNPFVRRQTVQFPSGPMRVVERYSAVVIEP